MKNSLQVNLIKAWMYISLHLGSEIGCINISPMSSLRPKYFIEPKKREFIENLPENLKLIASKFYKLMKATLKVLSLSELKQIFIEFITIDLWGAIKQIPKKIKESFKSMTNFFKRIKEKGIISFIKEAFFFLKNLPAKIKEIFNLVQTKLKSLSKKEMIEYICKIATFLIATYLGYNMPDLDISLFGIGFHRHFFFHSVLPAAGIYLTGKLINRFTDHVANKLGREDNDLISALEMFKSIINSFTSGAALGISLHLSQDLFIDGSQTIRGLWSRDMIPDILRTNYRFDDGYLLFNQVAGYGLAGKSKR